FSDHLLPFTEGALKLDGETKMASAVMPYYTISYKIDNVNNENVGNAYNKYLINDLLRGRYGFEGVICTDWGVTRDETTVDGFGSTCWGVENLSEAERHYKIIMAGADQFGGNDDAKPVVEAYKMGIAEHGEKFMRQRMEQSAVRLLMNIFRVGLFENPYLDPEESKNITGNSEFMKAGFDAQLKSIVMLKNKDKTLPLAKNKSVYIPKRLAPAGRNFFMEQTRESFAYPVNINVVKSYFNLTEDPDEADFALVVINSPTSGNGYDRNDASQGGNGYLPISLQYLSYNATEARDPSIAGGDPLEKFTNRTYRGKSVTASNVSDLKMVLDTKQAMGDKPVVVAIRMSNPMIFNEFEEFVEAIIVTFGVQDQAIMEIISGNTEPSGLLPVQMPSDMSTVEKQFEDVPFDMKCHTDSEGNTYDFGFGLNWNGIIKDSRTEKYRSSPK
ncbi:MAG: glycoside hydrolase family 3 protein, partial [Bacteroidetes bacterium]|nr:glycoside hydrolase family 3 protein [Bacteroidota bacterium]